MIIIVGPGETHKGPDTGCDLGNMHAILYFSILHIHTLTPVSLPMSLTRFSEMPFVINIFMK